MKDILLKIENNFEGHFEWNSEYCEYKSFVNRSLIASACPLLPQTYNKRHAVFLMKQMDCTLDWQFLRDLCEKNRYDFVTKVGFL